MEMTPYECAKMWYSYKYHNAKSLRTLAELNACSIEEMRMTLLEAGVNPKGLPRAERKKKGETEMTEENVKTEVKSAAECEAKQEYNLPPAPHYAEKLPKVWRLEELAATLDRVFAEVCEEECRNYKADYEDEIRGMYALCSFVSFRQKLLKALAEQKEG